MIKAILYDYKSVNDSLDVMYYFDYSTNKFDKAPYWVTVHLTHDGKPAMFWVRKFSEHKEALEKLYPEYDFSGEIDAWKYAEYKEYMKKLYPQWECKNGNTE